VSNALVGEEPGRKCDGTDGCANVDEDQSRERETDSAGCDEVSDLRSKNRLTQHPSNRCQETDRSWFLLRRAKADQLLI
jgi:hypothetical protein